MAGDFISTIADNGFRGCAFMSLRKYLERSIEDRKIPEPCDIVGNILPLAAKGGFLCAKSAFSAFKSRLCALCGE